MDFFLNMLNFKHSTVIFLVFQTHFAFSQPQWAWISGDKSADVNRVYGTPGVAEISNTPGGRIGAAWWRDNNGNMWLFGGKVKDGNLSQRVLNDLWMYNASTEQWAWIGGDKNTQSKGRYESKGVESSFNIPGARQNGISWTDNNGNFWLFGGLGMPSEKKDEKNKNENTEPGMLNDLWMYSISNRKWTFVSGTDEKNKNGRYGTPLLGSSSNYPGGRYSASGWNDNNGNLWLFGGRGYSSHNEITLLDDVWKYSPSDNSWTFMKGDENGNADVSYGQKENFSNINTPGGRHGCMSWVDINGNFWLMGGGTVTDLFADLWKYDPVNNQWAWFNGNNHYNQPPVVTQPGVPNAGDHPGARTLSASWIDDAGDVWLFGGNGYGGNSGSNSLNDLWKYSTAINQWAFMKGEVSIDPRPVYGTKGVAADENNPGGMANCAFWKDAKGDFLLFGGRSGNNYLDQVWKLSFKCTVTLTGTISPDFAVICEGGSQILTATGGSSYEWRRNNEVIPGETKSTITATQGGSYSVIIFTDEGCSAAAANTAEVTVKAITNAVRYTDKNAFENIPIQLTARNAGTHFEWTPATGLDDPFSEAPLATLNTDQQYVVLITSEQGCSVADTQFVKVTKVDNSNNKVSVGVSTAFTPNGNNVNDRLRPLGDIVKIKYFKVYNRWGNLVFQTNVVGDGWDGRYHGVDQGSDTYSWVLSAEMRDGKLIKMTGKTLLIR
ncbi:MAG TPA: kelch repeat-containing protein [Flavitalea sp.]|nr:kelch repeat-containing protein [Flavitalea sp.]